MDLSQIACCNKIANKDKSKFYSNLIAENKNDSRKLWKEHQKILNRVPEVKLPSNLSRKPLADRFASLFIDKIKTIREKFSFNNPDPSLHPKPSSDPPAFEAFSPVSEDDVHKLILNSPTKSCLSDPWPTFLVKECPFPLLPG